MEALEPIVSFWIGKFRVDITPEMLIQWAILLILFILAWWSTRDLKIKPNKKQVIVESIYETVKNLVYENVGEKYKDLIPFIGSMAVYLLLMNLVGLVGVVPPTKSFSVTVGLAAISFVVVQGYAIKKHGFGSYLKGYTQPIPMMLPINILERVTLPISLALRLFGNVLAATFIIELVYESLSKVAWAAQLVIPVALHGYFDIFDGVIQMVIFIMLTMINIKIVSEH